MAYKTYIQGKFVLRKGVDQVKLFEDPGLETVEMSTGEDGVEINGREGVKMYYAEEMLDCISKNLNGMLHYGGEEQGDVYDIVFKNGETKLVDYLSTPMKPKQLSFEQLKKRLGC